VGRCFLVSRDRLSNLLSQELDTNFHVGEPGEGTESGEITLFQNFQFNNKFQVMGVYSTRILPRDGSLLFQNRTSRDILNKTLLTKTTVH